MRSRLEYLLLAVVAGLAGAAAELADIATVRPWTPMPFWRTAAELALFWSLSSAGVAGARLLTMRAPARAGAWLCPLMGWVIAAFLVELDGGGKLDTGLLLVVGLLALASLLWLHRRADRFLARLPLAGRWPAWPPAALLLLAWAVHQRDGRLPPAPAATATKGAPNVLWISLDTLRADHLGCYGNPRGLTPHLDDLAKEGVLFETLVCPMPLTAPSHTAMLTGLPPHESGVTKNGQPIPHGTASLPLHLAAEGYATGGFVSGFPLQQRSSHFADHFRWYDDEFEPRAPVSEGGRLSPLGNLALRARRHFQPWKEQIHRDGRDTVDRALRWLDDETTAERPFCLFLHLYDVHGDYEPREPGVEPSRFWKLGRSQERMEFLDDPAHRAHLERLYDGEVRYVDRQVERLFDWLRQRGRWDDTLVLVTADHGESLGEHDYWYEHVDPYHVETHVPALFKLPRGEAAGTRVRGPAQTTDLAATVIALLGAGFELPGASLVGAIESGAIGPRLILSQSMFDYSNGHFVASVWDGRFKLLRREAAWENYDSRRIPRLDQLFDVQADPGETRNLLVDGKAPEGVDLEALQAVLDDYVRKCFALGPAHVDPEVAENLKRLGYGR